MHLNAGDMIDGGSYIGILLQIAADQRFLRRNISVRIQVMFTSHRVTFRAASFRISSTIALMYALSKHIPSY